MTIALDYTRRKTILDRVALRLQRAPAVISLIYIRVGGKKTEERGRKTLILQNPTFRVSVSLYIRRFYTYCITDNVIYRTTTDLKCNIHFMKRGIGGYLADVLNIPLFCDTFPGCILSLHVNYKIKILIANLKIPFFSFYLFIYFFLFYTLERHYFVYYIDCRLDS